MRWPSPGASGAPAPHRERLSVSAEVTFDKLEAAGRSRASALTVRGVVPGMTEADFITEAEAARDGCPISVALKGNVDAVGRRGPGGLTA